MLLLRPPLMMSNPAVFFFNPASLSCNKQTEPPKPPQPPQGEQKQWWQPDDRWREEDGLYVDGLQVSELPDSFDDALDVAVDCARRAFESGRDRVRIDFDTTAGDLTYTTLKNSLPLVRIDECVCLVEGRPSCL